jgi:hypothetical protein
MQPSGDCARNQYPISCSRDFKFVATNDGYSVLDGRIDAVTSSGYIEGWAFDLHAPLRPLTVSVQANGREVAQGLANRFRWDLAEAGCGSGWCAFRLRLSGAISRVRRADLSLWDFTQQTEIGQRPGIPLADDHEPGLSVLDDIVAEDPTVVRSIEQLRGCGQAFANFIATEGAAILILTFAV